MSDPTSPSQSQRRTRRNIKAVMTENMMLNVIDPDTLPHRYAKLNGLEYRENTLVIVLRDA
jgi:hypothetical protein